MDSKTDLKINWIKAHLTAIKVTDALAYGRTCGQTNDGRKDELTDKQTHWLKLTYWSTDLPADWLADRLTDWLTDRLTSWQTDWLTDWLADGQTD